MKNILLINGAKTFAHSNGQLNDTLTELAQEVLLDLGHQVQVTRADSEYDAKVEVEKFLWADTVIYQMPGWWMGAPWTVKKYIDDVFTEGHGSLYANDGRSRSDASKKYGFHGVGVDGVYLPFHKANQFLGMQTLPTFIVNDVIKAPEVEAYMAQYRDHLTQVFA